MTPKTLYIKIQLFALLIVGIGLIAALSPAQAQDGLLDTAPAPDPYAIENVPDEYIEEALAFYDKCESSIEYNQHYDCECLSAKYLDKRIENGPHTGGDVIMMSIEEQCADATQAAGYYYQNCLESQNLVSTNVPIEQYCECFANEYGKIYENASPEPNSRTFVAIQTHAILACQKPEKVNLYKRD